MTRKALLLALPPMIVLSLVACKDSDKPAQDARAMGEVLPGSASDAMIPLDTVRSQPPLAPPPTASAKHGAGKARDSDEADAAATEAATEEAPVIAIPPASPATE